jgi:hypothetical protein
VPPRAATTGGGKAAGGVGNGGAPATGGRTPDSGDGGGSTVDAGAADASRDCELLDADVPDAAPAAYCGAAAAAACGPRFDEAACEALIAGRLAQVPACCRGALAALFECAGRYGMRCSELSGDALFAPECAAVEEQWDRCTGSGDNCTEVHKPASGSALASCWIECDQYAATCSFNAPDQASCTCIYGPQRGHAFGADVCDPATIAAACK